MVNKDKIQNILCVVLPIVFVVVLATGFLKSKADKEELAKLKESYESSINTSAKPQEDFTEDDDKKDAHNKEEKEAGFTDKSVLFLGDGVSVDGKYQGIVADELKLKNYVNGARSGLLLGEMDDEITADSVKDIDIVIVFGGTNDYSRGKQLGSISDTSSADTFYGNVQGVIEYLKSIKEDIEIVFLTPLKHGYIDGQPSYPNANYNGNYLDDYVDAIIEVCENNNVNYIDAFNDSGINENNVGEYTYNNIILNDLGHDLVGKFIAENLAKIYEN